MRKILATILAAGMVLSLASCGKEPEQSGENNVSGSILTEQSGESRPSQQQSLEGEYKSNDTEEHFKIYNLTDTGFLVEFYHFEEGLLEKFDYEMEFDNADKTVASEKGSIDDNGGWEYTFYMGDGAITVTWQQSSQVYTRVTV
ncbi:MAG: hypothetical protein K5881_02725 [Saccharofermentans sp.]|nr:hypothetical protein [Saccharofermentans sp.]